MVGDNKTCSSDFTLIGLFTHGATSGFLFSIICAVFFMAMIVNGVMIFLIHIDPYLHTPMYFLLSHLSFIDMMYISTIVPKMLVNYLVGKGTISFAACTAQHFLYMGFVGAEFFLLGLMAYDRYVAICNPLRYPVLMSHRVCWMILASSWFGGALDSFLLTPITMSLPFCSSRKINHFFCEAPTMLRLACGDKAAYEMILGHSSTIMGSMEVYNTSSTDFTLMGLFNKKDISGLLFAIVSIIFFTALMANGIMIFLIHTDSRLHTPMYFLLSHLSFIDMMYISTIVPKMLVDYLLGQRTISFMGCTAQHFLYLTLVGAEFFLLGLMAYDRYVAICNPLRYPVLMSRQVCWMIIAGSWFGGFLDGFLLTPITMTFPFCNSREINHFFCEAPAVLSLACADTALYETVMYVCCVLMLLIPFSVVIASYAQILTTVHHMSSVEGRKKAFATCSSHMTVVTLFYGAAMYTYMLPHSYHSPAQDTVFSVFYTILTPMLNPLIYSLRNKDVTGALKRAMGRFKCTQKVSGDVF
ncbi:olfactory receptor 2T1 isoform X2 [Panthera tigris]|nr:olfactory receptor 2T1 isoform X2 [Panthera tigris]XP_042836866.1 olfactory receptor 2T1 isoform X2 [Panthera tigris]